MVSLSGGGSSQRSASVPWITQQPYLQDIYQRAQGLSNVPIQQFPNAEVAPQSEETKRYIAAVSGRGLGPLTEAAQGQARGTLQGDYLNANPWLDRTYDAASRGIERSFNRAVLPSLRGAAAASGGRNWSQLPGGERDARLDLGTTLNDLATNIYGGNYQAERNRQLGTLQMAPQIGAMDLGDYGALAQAGGVSEDYGQRVLDSLIRRFTEAQYEPLTRLEAYSNLIGQPVPSSAAKGKSLNLGFTYGGFGSS